MEVTVALFQGKERQNGHQSSSEMVAEKERPEPLKVKVVVPVIFFLTEHHVMEAHWGIGGIAPHILDLGTRWR
jgi:hypothetical protein